MEQINELINNLDFSDLNAVRDFINNIESGMYSGKFNTGEEFILMAQKGEEISLHQVSNNSKIAKIDIYQIDEDETNGVMYSEVYEPIV